MNNYFTPYIEDLRVGYECETVRQGYADVWKSRILDEEWISKVIFRYDEWDKEIDVRVPYLTKEQIEAEGWKHIDKVNNWFIKENEYLMIYKFQSHNLQLATINDSSWAWKNVIFDGNCPSINEFKYIQKLLNIK